jgi:cyclophilin family peptidyl-prolyl cis-trans isomerase
MKPYILTTAFLLSIAFTSSAQKRTKVVIETDSGRIVLALYNGTPQHRDNMIKLVKRHFYDSILWHRVIPEFMIQTGDPDSRHAKPGAMLGEGDVGYTIPAEIKDEYYHVRGAVGAARDNNPEKKSSGCQFYIVVGKKFTDEQLDADEKRGGHKSSAAQRAAYKSLGGAPHLDGNYTVFGEVIEGMDVADKIANAARNNADRPNGDIHIKRMYLDKKKRFFIF